MSALPVAPEAPPSLAFVSAHQRLRGVLAGGAPSRALLSDLESAVLTPASLPQSFGYTLPAAPCVAAGSSVSPASSLSPLSSGASSLAAGGAVCGGDAMEEEPSGDLLGVTCDRGLQAFLSSFAEDIPYYSSSSQVVHSSSDEAAIVPVNPRGVGFGPVSVPHGGYPLFPPSTLPVPLSLLATLAPTPSTSANDPPVAATALAAAAAAATPSPWAKERILFASKVTIRPPNPSLLVETTIPRVRAQHPVDGGEWASPPPPWLSHFVMLRSAHLQQTPQSLPAAPSAAALAQAAAEALAAPDAQGGEKEKSSPDESSPEPPQQQGGGWPESALRHLGSHAHALLSTLPRRDFPAPSPPLVSASVAAANAGVAHLATLFPPSPTSASTAAEGSSGPSPPKVGSSAHSSLLASAAIRALLTRAPAPENAFLDVQSFAGRKMTPSDASALPSLPLLQSSSSSSSSNTNTPTGACAGAVLPGSAPIDAALVITTGGCYLFPPPLEVGGAAFLQFDTYWRLPASSVAGIELLYDKTLPADAETAGGMLPRAPSTSSSSSMPDDEGEGRTSFSSGGSSSAGGEVAVRGEGVACHFLLPLPPAAAAMPVPPSNSSSSAAAAEYPRQLLDPGQARYPSSSAAAAASAGTIGALWDGTTATGSSPGGLGVLAGLAKYGHHGYLAYGIAGGRPAPPSFPASSSSVVEPYCFLSLILEPARGHRSALADALSRAAAAAAASGGSGAAAAGGPPTKHSATADAVRGILTHATMRALAKAEQEKIKVKPPPVGGGAVAAAVAAVGAGGSRVGVSMRRVLGGGWWPRPPEATAEGIAATVAAAERASALAKGEEASSDEPVRAEQQGPVQEASSFPTAAAVLAGDQTTLLSCCCSSEGDDLAAELTSAIASAAALSRPAPPPPPTVSLPNPPAPPAATAATAAAAAAAAAAGAGRLARDVLRVPHALPITQPLPPCPCTRDGDARNSVCDVVRSLWLLRGHARQPATAEDGDDLDDTSTASSATTTAPATVPGVDWFSLDESPAALSALAARFPYAAAESKGEEVLCQWSRVRLTALLATEVDEDWAMLSPAPVLAKRKSKAGLLQREGVSSVRLEDFEAQDEDEEGVAGFVGELFTSSLSAAHKALSLLVTSSAPASSSPSDCGGQIPSDCGGHIPPQFSLPDLGSANDDSQPPRQPVAGLLLSPERVLAVLLLRSRAPALIAAAVASAAHVPSCPSTSTMNSVCGCSNALSIPLALGRAPVPRSSIAPAAAVAAVAAAAPAMSLAAAAAAADIVATGDVVEHALYRYLSTDDSFTPTESTTWSQGRPTFLAPLGPPSAISAAWCVPATDACLRLYPTRAHAVAASETELPPPAALALGLSLNRARLVPTPPTVTAAATAAAAAGGPSPSSSAAGAVGSLLLHPTLLASLWRCEQVLLAAALAAADACPTEPTVTLRLLRRACAAAAARCAAIAARALGKMNGDVVAWVLPPQSASATSAVESVSDSGSFPSCAAALPPPLAPPLLVVMKVHPPAPASASASTVASKRPSFSSKTSSLPPLVVVGAASHAGKAPDTPKRPPRPSGRTPRASDGFSGSGSSTSVGSTSVKAVQISLGEDRLQVGAVTVAETDSAAVAALAAAPALVWKGALIERKL